MLNSDKPIAKKEQDFFQRAPFAKRISNLINNRLENNSISIGIYGKWGEGKTSVLNLIKNGLGNDVYKVDFNPWLFSNEEQLLSIFFSLLAESLKSLKDSQGKKIKDSLLEYSEVIGGVTSLMGFAGVEKVTNAVKKISQKSLEQRKEEVGNALVKSEKRVVVFLDDLDRLNTEELYSIFRLVKLTGDFKNIVYILAFDDELVSKMLSKRYQGEGRNYLEKIIQLPLEIPKAQQYALRQFCLIKINELFKENNCQFLEDELYEFEGSLNLYISPFLENPRVAVRFMNSLGFAIPLLVKEVNLLDLFLIEWIKVKFPDVYFAVRDNRNLFLKNYSSDQKNYDFSNPQYTKEDLDIILDAIYQKKNSIEKKQIQRLLTDLFPNLNQPIFGTYGKAYDSEEMLLKQKICTQDYFDRYFTYTVIEGQISDVEFNLFKEKLFSESLDDQSLSIFNRHTPDQIAFKLHVLVKSLPEDNYISFSRSLASIAYRFPLDDGFFSFLGSFGTITYLVSEVIKKLPEKVRFNETKKLFKMAEPIYFSWELWFKFHPKEENFIGMKWFSEEEYGKLTTLLFELTTKNKTFDELMNELPRRYKRDLLKIWSKNDKRDIFTNTRRFILKDKESPLRLIKVFSSWTSSSDRPQPYVSGFSSLSMGFLTAVINRNLLEKRLKEVYGKQKAPRTNNDRDPISDEELVGLYQLYCRNYRRNQRKKRKEKS